MARISEIKKIDIAHQCVNNPVYVKWVNRQGGLDYWLFGYRQINGINVYETQSIERTIVNLQNADTRSDYVRKKAIPNMTLGAIVPNHKLVFPSLNNVPQYPGLAGILTSVKVKMLVNTNPIMWHTIKVQPGNFKVMDNKNGTQDFEIVVDLIEIFNQGQ